MLNKLIQSVLLSVLVAFIVTNTSFAQEKKYLDEITQLSQLISTNLKKAEQEIKKLEIISDRFNQKERSHFELWVGVYNIYLSKYDIAIELLKESISNAPVNDKIHLAKIYKFLTTVSLLKKDYSSALEYAKKQLDLILYIDDIKIKGQAYIGISNLFILLEEYKIANKYIIKALDLNGNDEKDICTLKVLESYVLANTSSIKKAKEAIKLASKLCEKSGSLVLKGMLARTEAFLLINAKELQSSIASLNRALKFYQEIAFLREINMVYALKAKNYLELEAVEQALKQAEFVEEQPEDVSHYEAKQIAHEVLGEIAYQRQHYQKAYYHSRKEKFYHKWLYDDAKMKRLAVEAAKFNFEELERDLMFAESRGYMMSGLELKHRSRISKLESQSWYNDMLIVILSGLLLSSWMFVAVWMYRARVDKTTGLRRFNQNGSDAWKLYQDSDPSKAGFGIAIVELDNLMAIVDHFGDSTGTRVMRGVAEVLKNAIGKGRAYRADFNRFYLYILQNEHQQVVRSLEQAFADIGKVDGGFKQLPLQVRVSIGYDVLERGQSRDVFAKTTQRANVALNEAKDLGGNKLIPYSTDIDNDSDDSKRQMRFVQFIDPELMGPAGKLF